jgi:lysine 2,3-aminomutase
MRDLMQRLLAARVRPYYIYMCDQVAGAEHFKTSVETGLEIVRGLRGWTSGLAVPHFVIDAPGGGGKIPLLPEYVERVTEDEVVLRNYRGRKFVWRQPREDALVAAGIHEPEYGIVSIDVAARKSGTRRAAKRKRA